MSIPSLRDEGYFSPAMCYDESGRMRSMAQSGSSPFILTLFPKKPRRTQRAQRKMKNTLRPLLFKAVSLLQSS